MPVLLVEDDIRLGEALLTLLKREGFEADWAKDGEEVFAYFDYKANAIYDVVILDWMLPVLSGPEVCKRLRDPKKYNYQGGILFLTAKDTLEDKVEGLAAGGDDYLPKPFENAELLARLKALSRRAGRPYLDNVVENSELVLNRKEHCLYWKEKAQLLSAKEFEIFDLLFVNMGKMIPRETIVERVWGEEDCSQANLDSFIYLLRKKLKKFCPLIEIVSMRGVGYGMKYHD